MPNEKQFLRPIEVWFQRTYRLRAIWQDPSKPHNVKQKAFRLWGIMYQRILCLTQKEKFYLKDIKNS